MADLGMKGAAAATEPAPGWLKWAAVAAFVACMALVSFDVFQWHPGYGVGDESDQMRRLQALLGGAAPEWAFAQGSLHRNALGAWLTVAGPSLAALHLPGVLLLALEFAALFAVVRRHFGRSEAHAAVLVLALWSATWMAGRSILTYPVAPLELLLLWAAARWVRSPRSAVAWGLAALLPALDYEASLLALPFVWGAAWETEDGFRRQAKWVATGALAGALVLALSQAPQLLEYTHVRRHASVGAPSDWLGAWATNLRGAVLGGRTLSYTAVAHWPGLAPWSWPVLLLGGAVLLRRKRLALLAWGAAVLLLSQAGRAPYGLPLHRWTAAAPALAVIGALGLLQLGRRAGWRWAGILLLLGALSEGWAWYRHVERAGPGTWGRSERLQAAFEAVAAKAAPTDAVDCGLLELAYPEAAFHGRSREGGGDRWVLLPAHARTLLRGSAGLLEFRRHPDEEGFLALRKQRPAVSNPRIRREGFKGWTVRRWTRCCAPLGWVFVSARIVALGPVPGNGSADSRPRACWPGRCGWPRNARCWRTRRRPWYGPSAPWRSTRIGRRPCRIGCSSWRAWGAWTKPRRPGSIGAHGGHRAPRGRSTIEGPTMRISGYTIARNAIRYGYPLEQSLRSLLPLVDELVVAVGRSEDKTEQLVRDVGGRKVKVLRTEWDERLREGGRILSQQSNLALAACRGDWAVYLQADEVLHEDELPLIERACARHARGPVEGLRFDYLHFYGSYQTVQAHWRKWYRSAIRAVKTGRGIVSVGDAYGFRLGGEKGRRLLSLGSGARVFHYGWCRPPQVMAAKQRNLDRLYHDDAWLAAQRREAAKLRAFYDDRGHLAYFRGSHPAVMAAKVAAQDWSFEHGIERQAPAWARWLEVALLWPWQKRWRRWRRA
jgi:hypothetical protein